MTASRTTASSARDDRREIEDVVTAVVTGSRALLGVAVRSLAALEDELTLVQYRALVLLASRGGLNVSDLAEGLAVHPSTATRLCDRLVAKGFVDRTASSESRREIKLSVTAAGRTLLRSVTARRRREIRRIVERLSSDERDQLRVVFGALADAAGEIELPDDAWKLGWAS